MTTHPGAPDDWARVTLCTGYRREPPSHTEIRIKGRLSAAVIASLGQVGTEVLPQETVIRGDVDDAALYALIDRIGELGLQLLAVRRFPPGAGPP
jgi:hypothetical protein